MAYAVAFNVAQPWLGVTAPAPPWFGSGGESSVRGADLDAAYRGFLHALEWWLTGRSDDAAKAAAEWGYEEELDLLDQLDQRIQQDRAQRRQIQLDMESPGGGKAASRGTAVETEVTAREPESRCHPPAASSASPSAGYRTYRSERMAEEEKGGGRLRGCLLWVVGLLAIGALVLVILFSLDVASPRDKPCPLNSPPIPTPAQIAVADDLFRDGCVRISGSIVSRDTDELVMEVDRGEYVQRVNVRDPSRVLEAFPPGRVVTLAGWLRVEEDGTYVVHFVPDHGPDREWWRNLLENIEGLF